MYFLLYEKRGQTKGLKFRGAYATLDCAIAGAFELGIIDNYLVTNYGKEAATS